MYCDGCLMDIIIDDQIPWNDKDNVPAFSRGMNELWVMIVEKAWAKINKCYENTIAGTCAEALRALTGCPINRFSTKDGEQDPVITWDQIKIADESNFIMTSSMGEAVSNKDQGLVSNHAQSLISVHEVKDGTGKEIQLVRLRNPWGTGEWTGDWSDKSNLWTDKLKKDVNFTDADDGLFFIDFKNFLKTYESISICEI